MRSRAATLVPSLLLALAVGANTHAASLPEVKDVCAWITDIEGIPTPTLDAEEDRPDDCSRVLRCLNEAREGAAWVGDMRLTAAEESACTRVAPLARLVEVRVRELVADVPSDLLLPGSPPDSPALCRRFLTCVADSHTEDQNRPDPATRESASGWKPEFDRICAQVSTASSLSPEQVRELVEDCERLALVLRSSEDPSAKIFLRRLEMCKSFFEYALELAED